MRWLLPRLILVLFLFAGALSAVILFGHQQPLPGHLSILHLTDCHLPCWIGIIPGVTSIDEAEQRILKVYGQVPQTKIERLEQGLFVISDKASGKMLVEVLLDGDKPVHLVRFSSNNQLPSIGELMAVLGQPSDVSEWLDTGLVISPALLYKNDHLGILVNFASTRLPTLSPEFSTSPDSMVLADDLDWRPRTNFVFQPWSGFHMYENLEIFR